jgi:hypothetical protein
MHPIESSLGSEPSECARKLAMFNQELNFFVKNQERLVKEHPGKAITIKGEEILGVFDSPLEAYLEVQRNQELGSVMIQVCVPGPEAYTVTIN